jgi:hypothetical protein
VWVLVFLIFSFYMRGVPLFDPRPRVLTPGGGRGRPPPPPHAVIHGFAQNAGKIER